MRSRVAIILTSLIASMLAFAAPVAAADFGNCANNYPNGINFAGYDGPSGGQKHGVSATIDGQVIHQCSNPGFIVTTGSFAWVGLDGGGGSDGNVIMQLGDGECRDPGINGCDSGFHWYYAWGRDASATGCAGFSHRNSSPQTLSGYDGAAHDFKVYHQNNAWRFFIGSTQVTSVSEASMCWTPTNATWFEETWDPGDALGGSLADKLGTNLANYANAENGGFFWASFPSTCKYNPAAPRHCVRVNSTSFNVWTDR